MPQSCPPLSSILPASVRAQVVALRGALLSFEASLSDTAGLRLGRIHAHTPRGRRSGVRRSNDDLVIAFVFPSSISNWHLGGQKNPVFFINM
jgi:hypothetical protein